jgi:hypothetical protein
MTFVPLSGAEAVVLLKPLRRKSMKMKKLLLLSVAVLLVASSGASAQSVEVNPSPYFAPGPSSPKSTPLSPSDQEIAQKIVQESREAYFARAYGGGHRCACPYDSAKDGSSCGRRSAYGRPGGWEPKCYPSDVTASEILDWKNRH